LIRGKVLVLKREVKERMINNFNTEMIRAWNANMDIQLVVDPYAVISYIASYMLKTDTQTTPFLRETLHASAGKEVKEKLRALKEAYIGHRQIGAAEAAYKVNPSLKMKDSNISTLFVITGFPKNRSVFFKRVNDNQDEIEGYESDFEESDNEDNYNETEEMQPPKAEIVKIEGRPGTYQVSITLIARYVARPRHLDDICLGQFATAYVYASKVPKRIIFDDDGCSTEFSDQKIFEDEEAEEDKFLCETMDIFEKESNSSGETSPENEGESKQNLYHLLPKYRSIFRKPGDDK
jgi:hypothetical protein